MITSPTIAAQRHTNATLKFTNKLDALDLLFEEGKSEKFPKRISVASFALWEDEVLGVQKISRSVIYSDTDSYIALRKRMDTLLARLLVIRTRVHKKENKESILRDQLEAADARAKSFVNQYSSVMAELFDARKEIARLNLRLARQVASRRKVVSLHTVPGNAPSEG